MKRERIPGMSAKKFKTLQSAGEVLGGPRKHEHPGCPSIWCNCEPGECMNVPKIPWCSMEAALPEDGQFVLLLGPSGYITTPYYIVVGRRDEEFRPRLADGKIRWLTISNDAISDGELEPTHWALLPNAPEKE